MDKIKQLITISFKDILSYKEIFIFLLLFVIRFFKKQLIIVNIYRMIGIIIISAWPLIIISYFNEENLLSIADDLIYFKFILTYKIIFFPLIILIIFIFGEFFKYFAGKKEINISSQTALLIFKKLLEKNTLDNQKIQALTEDDENNKFISDILLARAIRCIVIILNASIYIVIGFFIILYVKPSILIFFILLLPLFMFFLDSYRNVVNIEDKFQTSKNKLRRSFTIENLTNRNNSFSKRLLIQQKINSLTSFGFGCIITFIFLIIIYFFSINNSINFKQVMILMISFQFLYFGIKSLFSNVSTSLRFIPRVKRANIIENLKD